MTQLQAIIGSCLKWWRIRYQGKPNGSNYDCPLCQRAGIKNGIVQCRGGGCPIQRKTGSTGCIDTPYSGGTHPSNSDASAELQFLFDLIKPRYYKNVRKELYNGDYPKKFRTWMLRAIAKKEE